MNSIKLSDFLIFKKARYVYLKITPDNSIRNYNSSSIVKAMSLTYKGLFQHIKTEGKKFLKFFPKKFIIEETNKFTYIIDIEKSDISFYFIVPELFENSIREKISQIWSKATIEKVEGIKKHSNESSIYQLSYKKQDGLSLKVDTKDNYPLNDILNVADIMHEGDRVTIYTNFMSISQGFWKTKYKKTIEMISKKEPLEKEIFSAAYIGKVALGLVLGLVDVIQETIAEFFGAKSEGQNKELNSLEIALGLLKKDDLSTATRKKEVATVIKNQIVVISESKDKLRQLNNSESVCQSYITIKEDNELVYKSIKAKKFNAEQYDYKVNSNYMSIEECHNFLQLPGRELQQKYKINHVNTLESEVPHQLQRGIIRAGINIYRGKFSNVYHTNDKELKNLAACICGPNRSGKSTLIANMVFDIIKAGGTVILPDFCGKCQLSDELAAVISKDKILNIDCKQWETLQGFGHNEIMPKDGSIFELYNCAKMKAAKLKELINLVNDGDNDLEGRMERYLEYAALVVFVCNGSVNDTFKVLKQHTLRHEYIEKIPTELRETMGEYVEELLEIDEWSKGTKDCPSEIIGTKQGHISAILSRVHRLKQNAYIEMMLKKETDNNINLINEMQKGKLICIRMYDNMFATQQQKDIYVCYWMTKIWGSLQKRFCDIDQDNLVQTVVLVDELYQAKNCEKYLTMILSQLPKYRAKLILSCHHLAQIPVIQEELKSALCSYIFIAGSNKKNFMAMKEEFEDKGYSLEDLLHLKRHAALNLLAYEEGYWAGITMLPPPLK